MSEWPCHYPNLPCVTQISHCAWERPLSLLALSAVIVSLTTTRRNHLAKMWSFNVRTRLALCSQSSRCELTFTSHPLGGVGWMDATRERERKRITGQMRTCRDVTRRFAEYRCAALASRLLYYSWTVLKTEAGLFL